MVTRRRLLAMALPAIGGISFGSESAAPLKADSPWLERPVPHLVFEESMARLEKESGGRLGVAVLDTANGARFGHRADERFPMCSTHKFLTAAAILSRVDRHQESLERVVRYQKSDLVNYSPATEKHVGEGMTVRDLCAAAITLSDNTAANLLLASIGGPAAYTAYTRTLGDNTTRLDRNEPTLNEATPGDPRDTTSPAAMVADLRTLTLGNALSSSSKTQLTEWLIANTTGAAKLRAGVPKDWKAGDKTGSGGHGTWNDVAVVWPPNRSPVFAAVYLTETELGTDAANRLLASVGREIPAVISR